MTLESYSADSLSADSFPTGAVAHPVRLADHRSRRALRPATVLVVAVEGVLDPEWLRGMLDAHGLSYRHLSVAELPGVEESTDFGGILDRVETSRPIESPRATPESAPSAPAVPSVTPVPVSRHEIGALVMDLDEMRVRVDGEPVALTHQEFLLLQTFLENPGRLFTRQQLLEQAWDYAGWGNDWGSGRTVDVHVRRLRVKLGEAASIATVRGFGYRFEPGPHAAA